MSSGRGFKEVRGRRACLPLELWRLLFESLAAASEAWLRRFTGVVLSFALRVNEEPWEGGPYRPLLFLLFMFSLFACIWLVLVEPCRLDSRLLIDCFLGMLWSCKFGESGTGGSIELPDGSKDPSYSRAYEIKSSLT